MPLFVNNLAENPIVNSQLTDMLELVVAAALKSESREDDPEVSLAIVDDAYIRDLNLKFRNKDSATDVLSFPMEEEGEDDPFAELEEENILGDIIISLETAERQAVEYGHSFLREMAFLTTHGMLHLLGYDHETEAERIIMREKEEQILASLDINR